MKTKPQKNFLTGMQKICRFTIIIATCRQKEIAEDKKYENITEIWLYGDHYKWRYMRSMGVDEKYCTGDASDYEKFFQYAKCIAYAAGNPLYHWTHLELQRFFGIYEPLNEKSAPKIWEKANEIIKSGDFTAQKLIEKSNVYLIGTTDDPVDSLEYHQNLKTFRQRLCPHSDRTSALLAKYIDWKPLSRSVSKHTP